MTGPSLLSPEQLEDLAQLARSAPAGAFVEVGVYRGGSARVLYDIAQEQGRTLYLFDTFAGHPIGGPHDDAIVHPVGRFGDPDIDVDALQHAMPHAIIRIGVFPDTLAFLYLPPIAFVHADADLYAPTLTVCKRLAPGMVDGGAILFDDYGYGGCPGVQRAVDECFGPPQPDGSDRRPGGQRVVTIRTEAG